MGSLRNKVRSLMYILTERMNAMETNMANNTATYERNIASLEEKIMTMINADANATLRTVTGFFQAHDKRITELACSIDVNDERSNKNEASITSIVGEIKEFNSGKCERQSRTHAIIDIDDDVAVGQESTLTLKSLEQRIDSLEDYSRRDNLIFYGFTEEKFEDFKEKVMNFIYKKLLPGAEYGENIQFVRIHRLGRCKNGATRPIIAQFKNYSDRMNVLKGYKNLKDNNPEKYSVSEDFSTNTDLKRQVL